MASGRRSPSGGATGAEIRARKGRGAVSNVAHRFESVVREADGDALDAAMLDDDPLPPLATSVSCRVGPQPDHLQRLAGHSVRSFDQSVSRL